MNYKGFTLVELLGVLVVLGLITYVSVPPIITSLKQTENYKVEQFERYIKNGAELYIERENNGNTGSITTQDLIDKGYIKAGTINPKTNNKITGREEITIIKNADGTLTFELKFLK